MFLQESALDLLAFVFTFRTMKSVNTSLGCKRTSHLILENTDIFPCLFSANLDPRDRKTVVEQLKWVCVFDSGGLFEVSIMFLGCYEKSYYYELSV